MNNVNERLGAAKALYIDFENIGQTMIGVRDSFLVCGWKLGEILNELKEEVGHGKWKLWLEGHWVELHERKAQRCMAFFRDNEGWTLSKNDYLVGFELNSVRKFTQTLVPPKERLQLENNEPDKPGAHHLTYVNAFSKWDRQFQNGSVEGFDLNEFRRENEPMIRRIVELGGRDWIYSILPPPC